MKSIFTTKSNDQLLIDSTASVFTIAYNKKSKHAFVVVESVDGDGRYSLMRAHLLHPNNASGVDHTKAVIESSSLDGDSIAWIQSRVDSGDYGADSFHITPEAKANLHSEIERYKSLGEFDYTKVGNVKVAGLVGKFLGAISAEGFKNASTQENHRLFGGDGGASKQSTHDSIDSLMHSGHSCVSWALEMVQVVKPEYQPTLLGRLLIHIPDLEIGRGLDAGETQGCRLM